MAESVTTPVVADPIDTETATQTERAIETTQDEIKETLATPLTERDIEWQKHFRSLAQRLDTLETNLLDSLTRLTPTSNPADATNPTSDDPVLSVETEAETGDGTDAETQGAESETIRVETRDTVERRPTRRVSRSTRSEAKALEDQAQQTTLIILTLLNTAASNVAGADAMLNPFERALIEPSFVRILMRADSDASAFAEYIDPIALVAGMAMWGVRVVGIYRQQRALTRTKYAAQPDETQSVEPTPLNGYRMDDAVVDAMQQTSLN